MWSAHVRQIEVYYKDLVQVSNQMCRLSGNQTEGTMCLFSRVYNTTNHMLKLRLQVICRDILLSVSSNLLALVSDQLWSKYCLVFTGLC